MRLAQHDKHGDALPVHSGGRHLCGALCGPQRSGGGQSGDAADHDEFRTGGPGGGGVLRSDLYPPWGKKMRGRPTGSSASAPG